MSDSLNSRVVRLMEKRSILRVDLAKAIGCSPNNLSQCLSGRRPLRRLVAKIADYFNVSVEYLTTGNEPISDKVKLSIQAPDLETQRDIVRRLERLDVKLDLILQLFVLNKAPVSKVAHEDDAVFTDHSDQDYEALFPEPIAGMYLSKQAWYPEIL